MTYELASNLKNAGFPQPLEDETKKGRWVGGYGLPVYYEPTLSELILACGDKLFKLHINNKERLYGIQEEMQSVRDVKRYKTPEEAVAKLWLELNKLQNKLIIEP